MRGQLLDEAERRAAEGPAGLSLEAIAEAVGVSRATAYRHFAGRDELLVALAIRRSQELTAGAREVVGRCATAARQLEEAVVYLARELPQDPVIMAMVRGSLEVIDDPVVWRAATDFLAPLVESARDSGEFRSDVAVEETMRWLVEQLFVAVMSPHRSEDQVRRRVTAFVVPSVASAPASGSAARAAAEQLRAQARAIAEVADGLTAG